MKTYLLYSLLGEYARQFGEATANVKTELKNSGMLPTERKRMWRYDGGHRALNVFGDEPTEDHDASLWEWVEVEQMPECIAELEQTLSRFASFVEGLEYEIPTK